MLLLGLFTALFSRALLALSRLCTPLNQSKEKEKLRSGVHSDAALHMSRTKSRKFLLLTSPKCALFAFEFNAAPCKKDARIYSVVMRL